MVRLWTLEAMAHGAELVSYFRWRQFPKGQEQFHAGLLRPDSAPAPALAEVSQVAAEVANLGAIGTAPRQVALLFDYASAWVTDIQPQGAGLSALWAAFACYSALRSLGLNIDILPSSALLDGYALCVLPCLPVVSDDLPERLAQFEGQIVIGPRSGSRTEEFATSPELPPGPLQRIFPGKVAWVESLPPSVVHSGTGWEIASWFEQVESSAEPELVAEDGRVAVWRHERVRYLASWPETALAQRVFTLAAQDAGLAAHHLPEGVRLRSSGRYRFVFNYGAHPITMPNSLRGARLIGEQVLGPGDVAVLNR